MGRDPTSHNQIKDDVELDTVSQEDIETVEVRVVPSHTPTPQLEHPEDQHHDDHTTSLKGGTTAKKPYTPDSVYTSIDGLRAIAVFFMVIKNAVGRFTLMSNPLAKALGADWIPPVFVFAAGARLVAEQEKLKETLDSTPKDSASHKRTLAEAFIKAYTKNIMVRSFHSCTCMLFDVVS